MKPLDGVTVLSLEHALSGPYCTRQLADYGARVIKIERPGCGDFARDYDDRANGLSSYFVWANRSKESMTIDLKQVGADVILHRILAISDVLVQNLAPGAAARLGLDYESLAAEFPSMIVCDISGYGSNGPYRDRKAYDLLIQSESGFVSVTGSEEQPAKAAPPIADIAAGTCGFSNILAALLHRAKTGEGCHIDVSMLDAMTEWMSYPLYYSFDGATPPARSGADHATIFPYGAFRTGDGGTVMLGLQNEREWRLLCERVLEQPELADDERFSSNSKRSDARVELRRLIEARFADLGTDAVIDKLLSAGIASARMNTMHDVWAHPQLRQRERFTDVPTPAGPLPALLPPGVPSFMRARMDAVPALGEHTLAIMRELGYSAGEIDELKKNGTITCS